MSFSGHRVTQFACALTLCVGLGIGFCSAAIAASNIEFKSDAETGITLVVRDGDIREVFEMVAKAEGLNIVMSDQIAGRVSVSLFDVQADEAIRTIAQAAGYGIDRRNGSYVLTDFDDLGLDTANGSTQIRSFKIQYSDPEKVREILEKHLSRYGKITSLEERRMIIVEDLPSFLHRIGAILEEIDSRPKQVLLEAKILEIGLTKDDTLGVDWNRLMSANGAELNIGVRGLTSGTAPGLFFNLMRDNLEGAIEALTENDRVRGLATPRLLTMENQEAEVIVGDRLGYRITTTINLVTTESVEFIETGVILRFTPSVDRQGRILLTIHPEVSNGTIGGDGIPRETTTEVTTQLLVEDGQRIFIGGLISDTAEESRSGIPLLSRIPILGLLFARSEWNYRSTETIVIVKASVYDPENSNEHDADMEQLDRYEPTLHEHRRAIEDDLDQPWRKATKDSADSRRRFEEDLEAQIGHTYTDPSSATALDPAAPALATY